MNLNHDVVNHDTSLIDMSAFSPAQVQHFQTMRDAYQRNEHMTLAEYRRLEFIRWLVATGKLTDQI